MGRWCNSSLAGRHRLRYVCLWNASQHAIKFCCTPPDDVDRNQEMGIHAVCTTIASCQSIGRTGWSVSSPWASTPLRCGVAAHLIWSTDQLLSMPSSKSLPLWALPLQLYVPWNYHERFPGQYTWDGMADVVSFIELIQVGHAMLAHHEVQGTAGCHCVLFSGRAARLAANMLQRCWLGA